jgi:hypothetical protein
MGEQSESKSRRWPIDVHLGWMVARGLQTFFLVTTLEGLRLALKSRDVIDLVSGFVMFVAIMAFFHRYSTGELDSNGIYYRRYIREKTLLWQDIREVRWIGSRLIFIASRGNFLVRRVDFVLNPATASVPYFRHRQGLDTSFPPILERIHALAGTAFKLFRLLPALDGFSES